MSRARSPGTRYLSVDGGEVGGGRHQQVLADVREGVALAVRLVGVHLQPELAGRRQRHRDDDAAVLPLLDDVDARLERLRRDAVARQARVQPDVRARASEPQLGAAAVGAHDGGALRRRQAVRRHHAAAGAPVGVRAQRVGARVVAHRAAHDAVLARRLEHRLAAGAHRAGALRHQLREDGEVVLAVARRTHVERHAVVGRLLQHAALQRHAADRAEKVLAVHELEGERGGTRVAERERQQAVARVHHALVLAQEAHADREEERLNERILLELGSRARRVQQLPGRVLGAVAATGRVG